MCVLTLCFSEKFIKLTIHFQDGSGTITTKELLPILRSIGQNPTEDEILNLVIEYDVNGDGTIDFDEFLEMMQKVSKGKQPNQKTRKNLDKIGYLNEKFKKNLNYILLLHIEDLDQSVEIEDAFKIFDRDGNGYIDAKEFKQVVTRMGNCLTNAEADEFMLEADLNGDGKLDFNEFMQMMLKSLSEDD